MATDKRHSTAEPLTEHDVAERLDRAALRVLRIMIDAENLGIVTEVQHSRYLTNALSWLAGELGRWGIEPRIPSSTSPDRRRIELEEQAWP
jgi:hypothetical protein